MPTCSNSALVTIRMAKNSEGSYFCLVYQTVNSTLAILKFLNLEMQSKLVIRNGFVRNKLVLRNHFPRPIVNLFHKDMKHLALRNNLRVTQKFLITKSDCNYHGRPRFLEAIRQWNQFWWFNAISKEFFTSNFFVLVQTFIFLQLFIFHLLQNQNKLSILSFRHSIFFTRTFYVTFK